MERSTAKEFKIALIRADLTPAVIAQKLGVTPRMVRYIIAGERRATKLRKLIVKEFALPADVVLAGKAV